MKIGYSMVIDGKFKSILLPKRHRNTPKSKRLRKKLLYLKCNSCLEHFAPYRQGEFKGLKHAVTGEVQYQCRSCVDKGVDFEWNSHA